MVWQIKLDIRQGPFLNQPPPPSAQPQIVEVGTSRPIANWIYKYPPNIAWGLGMTIRSTEMTIRSTEDSAKRGFMQKKANHLCPKNLVGLTVCKRHREDLPRTCDNRPRDSAARHQVWTQGLTAINLSKISSENIRKSLVRNLTMVMENGVLMTTDDSMK